jgi:hypothetical protein
MTTIINSISVNAGKLWQTLQTTGQLMEDQLREKTKLETNEFYSAVGWLARENKIHRDNTMYALGTTNLTGKIGSDAGLVWKVLDMWDEVDVSSISRLTHLDESEVYTALGWLACEGKIAAHKKIIGDKPTVFSLTSR